MSGFPVESIRESVIREMTRLCGSGCINLSQGYPDLDPPREVLEEALEAIKQGWNQYSVTWGLAELREAASLYIKKYYDLSYDPEREITITCGAAEGILSSILALCGQGDEVIFFEPYYENYLPSIIIAKSKPVAFPLEEDFSLDLEKLSRAFSSRTRAIIINTPNNPTGRIFSKEELEVIADLCQRHNCYIISDEIYHQIIYDGMKHTSPAQLLPQRTVLIHSLSKSYCLTGWRVGWVAAPAELTAQIRKVHDYATVAAPTPFQRAAIKALSLPDSYYEQLRRDLQQKRDFILDVLKKAGFSPVKPSGAYYTLAFFDGEQDDWQLAKRMIKEVGIAAVPGSSFFTGEGRGRNMLRFAFAKRWETLREVARRLEEFKL